MIAPRAEADPTLGGENTPHHDLTPEELAVIQAIILEKFRNVRDHIGLIPVRQDVDDSREISLHPVLPIAVAAHYEGMEEAPPLTIGLIINCVAQVFRQDPDEIRGRDRRYDLAHA